MYLIIVANYYIDIFAAEMDISLKKEIVSRGWHVYGKFVWKDQKKVNLYLRRRKQIKVL